jgi:hypothetical protein
MTADAKARSELRRHRVSAFIKRLTKVSHAPALDPAIVQA